MSRGYITVMNFLQKRILFFVNFNFETLLKAHKSKKKKSVL